MLPEPIFAFFSFGAPGLPELAIIMVIVLLLFGKRLPGVMRSVGQSIVEFKKGVKGIDDSSENGDGEPSATQTTSRSSQGTDA